MPNPVDVWGLTAEHWSALSALASLATTIIALIAGIMGIRQLRSLNSQVKLEYDMSHATATREALVHLDGVFARIADNGLWAYFCNHEPIPAPSHAKHDQVIMTAEMLVDVLEVSLELGARVPAFQVNRPDWEAYAIELWTKSPALRHVALAARNTWANDLVDAVGELADKPAAFFINSAADNSAAISEALVDVEPKPTESLGESTPPQNDGRYWFAAGLMCRALHQDPLWGPWVASRRATQRLAVRFLAAVLMSEARRGGWVRITPAGEGVMCWLTPGAPDQSVVATIAERILAPVAFGRDWREALALFDAMDRARASLGPHLYAEFLGVVPRARRQGLATRLGAEGINWAVKAGVPVYLETFGDLNVALYEAAGFQIVGHFEGPRHCRGWGMLRHASRGDLAVE